jgi:hypothetical protein
VAPGLLEPPLVAPWFISVDGWNLAESRTTVVPARLVRRSCRDHGFACSGPWRGCVDHVSDGTRRVGRLIRQVNRGRR